MEKNIFNTTLATLTTAITAIVGMIAIPFLVLIIAMISDVITGIAVALKEKTFDPEKMKGSFEMRNLVFKGAFKNVGIMFSIIVAFGLDILVPAQVPYFALFTTSYMAITELSSVLGNVSRLGVKIPIFLESVLTRYETHFDNGKKEE